MESLFMAGHNCDDLQMPMLYNTTDNLSTAPWEALCEVINDASTICNNKQPYDDFGAMIYIVVVIIIFAMAIALLIAAQMTYHPEGESQVTFYLKQRSILKDRILLQHIMRQKERRRHKTSIECNAIEDLIELDTVSSCSVFENDEASQPRLIRQTTFPQMALPSSFAHHRSGRLSQPHHNLVERAPAFMGITVGENLEPLTFKTRISSATSSNCS